MKATTIPFILLILLAVGVGLYPVLYLMPNSQSIGLLSSKPEALISSPLWNAAFYLHIMPGGLALLIGWPQFVKKIRNKHMQVHRALGKVYVLAILISGLAGLYLAFYANGGIVAKLGFGGLALAWLMTTSMAYIKVKNKQIEEHQRWMIRSYALCFAAVTLRLWLPLFTAGFQIEFTPAYRTISWLCWVPNLIIAEWIIFRLKKNKNLALG